MIGRSYRLPKELFVANKAMQTVRSPYFLIKTKENGLSHPRVGIIIGKNMASLAVKRHALRRWILPVLVQKIKKGYDVLIIGYPPLGSATKKEILNTLQQCIKPLS